MTTADTIDYDAIEPGVRELCRVLNASGLVRTLWSCEGHRPSIFGRIRPAHPFVIFHAPELVAKIIQASLYQARLDGRLRIDWTVGGNFPPGKHGSNVQTDDWQWNIKPWQEAMDSLSFALQRKFQRDLASMPEVIREALSEFKQPERRVELAAAIHPTHSNQRTDEKDHTEGSSLSLLASRITATAVRAGGFDVASDFAAASTAGNHIHSHTSYAGNVLARIAHGKITRKTALVFGLALALSACGTPSDVELQKDGSGTDEPRPSPCVGAAGSPCSPIPYTAPGFVWGRG